MRWVLVALGVACGCGGASRGAASPASVGVKAWVKAIEGDNARAAYDMLSGATKKELSFEAFEERWKDSAPERERQARGLREVMTEKPRLGEHGTVILAGGKAALLVHETDGWRLESPLMSSAHAATPKDALRLFASALEEHSFDAAMRLLTSTRRDAIRGMFDSFLAGIHDHGSDNVDIQGDRAYLRWGDGKAKWKITFRLEDGEWRIEDLIRQ